MKKPVTDTKGIFNQTGHLYILSDVRQTKLETHNGGTSSGADVFE